MVLRYDRNEDDYIAANWNTKTDDQIAEWLGRTPNSVRKRRCRLRYMRESRPEGRWKAAHIRYLCIYYRRMTDEQIGIKLGRTAWAVKTMRKVLRLLRDREVSIPSMRWSEGLKIQSADRYVRGLRHLCANDRVQAMRDRLDAVKACLLSLYENGPKTKHWLVEDAEAAIKLRDIMADLRNELYAGYAILTDTETLALEDGDMTHLSTPQHDQ